MKVIGPGFIAAVSGFELTNIIMFTKFGAAYGYLGFLLVIISMLPLTYLQQVISLPIMLFKESFIDYLKRLRSSIWYVVISSVIVSSLITLIINIIGLSVVLSQLTRFHWLVYALALFSLSWVISSNTILSEKAFKILSLLSLLLLVYIPVLVLNIKSLIETDNIVYTSISFIDLLALWGACAAPYSLIVQALGEEEDFSSIYVGLVVSVLIGFTIASTGYIFLYPSKSFVLTDSIVPIITYGPLALFAYVIGLSSSVLLASVTIVMTSSLLYAEVLRLNKNNINISSYVNHTILFLIFMTLLVAMVMHVDNVSLYTDIVILGSGIIGVMFTIPIIGLLAHYLHLYKTVTSSKKLLLINILYIMAIIMISIVLSILGLIEFIVQ